LGFRILEEKKKPRLRLVEKPEEQGELLEEDEIQVRSWLNDSWHKKDVDMIGKHHKSMMRMVFFGVVFLTVISRPVQSLARPHVIYASYKYIVGDNDTKNDAKRVCFIEAKRRCLEKAGTYIESQTVVRNYKLTKDEIRAYAAAIVKVEVVSELVEFQHETLAIFMTVRAEVEANDINKKIKEIKNDRALQKKIKEQENQLDRLERKIRELQKKTFLPDALGVSEIRKERKRTFDDLDKWERLRTQTVANKRRKNIRTFRSVRKDMTAYRVKYLIGDPYATYFSDRKIDGTFDVACGYNGDYGTVYILYVSAESQLYPGYDKHMTAQCIIDARCFVLEHLECDLYPPQCKYTIVR